MYRAIGLSLIFFCQLAYGDFIRIASPLLTKPISELGLSEQTLGHANAALQGDEEIVLETIGDLTCLTASDLQAVSPPALGKIQKKLSRLGLELGLLQLRQIEALPPQDAIRLYRAGIYTMDQFLAYDVVVLAHALSLPVDSLHLQHILARRDEEAARKVVEQQNLSALAAEVLREFRNELREFVRHWKTQKYSLLEFSRENQLRLKATYEMLDEYMDLTHSLFGDSVFQALTHHPAFLWSEADLVQFAQATKSRSRQRQTLARKMNSDLQNIHQHFSRPIRLLALMRRDLDLHNMNSETLHYVRETYQLIQEYIEVTNLGLNSNVCRDIFINDL